MILKNDHTKRSFWKVCRVEELFKGKDGNIRTAKVKVPSDKGNVTLIRPLCHLITIEVSAKESTNSRTHTNPIAASARKDNSKVGISEAQTPPVSVRPRRNDSVVGELIRKQFNS